MKKYFFFLAILIPMVTSAATYLVDIPAVTPQANDKLLIGRTKGTIDKSITVQGLSSFVQGQMSSSSSGVMLKSTYDPTGISASPFVRTNHSGTQAISTVTGLQNAIDAKANLTHLHEGTYEPAIPMGTINQFIAGNKTLRTLNSTAVIEGTNLYFTDQRAAAASPVQSVAGKVGNVSLTPSDVQLNNVLNIAQEPAFGGSTSDKYFRGDKTFQTLNTSAVVEGSNLYHTTARASAAAPVQSVAGRTGTVVLAQSDITNLVNDLSLKAPSLNPTFSGVVTLPVTGTTQCLHVDSSGRISGTGNDCGVGEGGGTSMVYPSAGIPVSTGSSWGNSISAPIGVIVGTTDAQSLSSKTLISPTLTGTPIAPTALITDNSTTVATTAYVKGQGYISGNQSISVSGDASATGTTSLATTVNGIKGKAIPTLATGHLKYTGSAWAFDNATYLTGNQTITLSGDITGSGTTSLTGTIGAGAVTLAKMANLPAYTLIGNITSGSATPTSVTASQAKTLLAIGESDVSNLVSHLNLKAPLASPALTGSPTAPTLAVGTNTTGLATTAFVIGQASSTTPVANGTAAVGTSTRYTRADHVHPTDTSRVATSTTVNGHALSSNVTVLASDLLNSGVDITVGGVTATGITASVITTSGVDGTHYVQPYNSVAFSGIPSEGMIQTTPSGLQIYHAGAWGAVSGSGTGGVASVYGRTGDVVATNGDYTVGQITGAEATANKDVVNGYLGIQSDGSVATPKQAGVADKWTFASSNSTDITGAGFIGPSSAVTNSWWIRLPASEPASANMIAVTGTPSAHIVPITYTNAPTLSAANMTSFPTLNQNTTGTAANLSGTPALPNGVTATTQAVNDNSTKVATTAYVNRPTPLSAGTSATLTGTRGYYVCTGTCTVALPVPQAGNEFCVYNDTNVATAITLSALGSSAMYENSARTAYGTAGTGTLSVAAAAGNKVCVVGRDATHYQILSSSGTVTVN